MAENNSKTLYQALWNSADILRSSMDANEYKNYLLGLVFYKYLSDLLLHKVSDLLDEKPKDLNEAQKIYEEAYNDPDTHHDIIENLMDTFSYLIEPKLTFTTLYNEILNNTFQLEDLAQGFRNIEQSDELFENLFEDIDLYARKLGSTPQKQNESISKLMREIAGLDLAYQGDALGDAYEFMIGEFASETGKKAGEFYTPHEVSSLITQIAIQGREDKKGFSVYDPTMGSGSLLLNAKRYSNEPDTVQYFGQEKNTSTFNLARMNMILHNVDVSNQHLRNGDTLEADWPTEEPTNFDAVLMNPPYSAKWEAQKGFLDDPRFAPYGVLAPKSKADYAFLLHGYYHLKENGTMAIVLPHGVLFRGAAEGKIRQILLENGAIDAVIGLPANLFFNTSIPTTVIILKKNRTNRDVYFIDASADFVKDKNQNKLNEEQVTKIVETYIRRENIDKYAHLVAFDEIKENDFNLNIPRYVDTFEEEEPISLSNVAEELDTIQKDIDENMSELFTMFDELTANTPEMQKELDDIKQVFHELAGDSHEK